MTYSEEINLDSLFRSGGRIVITEDLEFESGSIFLSRSIVFATGSVIEFRGGRR